MVSSNMPKLKWVVEVMWAVVTSDYVEQSWCMSNHKVKIDISGCSNRSISVTVFVNSAEWLSRLRKIEANPLPVLILLSIFRNDFHRRSRVISPLKAAVPIIRFLSCLFTQFDCRLFCKKLLIHYCAFALPSALTSLRCFCPQLTHTF